LSAKKHFLSENEKNQGTDPAYPYLLHMFDLFSHGEYQKKEKLPQKSSITDFTENCWSFLWIFDIVEARNKTRA
jgi:hypothetical protein